MTRQQILADCVRESRVLLVRYLKGFDDSNHTKQAPSLPNHIAWTLGHLALTMNRTAEKLNGQPVPESDFIKNDSRAGDTQRFDTESVSFGSKPTADPKVYPKYARCVAIFDASVERLATAVLGADDARLESPTKWGQGEVKLWTLLPRMVFHNGCHTGQIADLRRALNMGTILS
jgi:DinB family protein